MDDLFAETRAVEVAKSSRAEGGRIRPRVGAVVVKEGRILAEAHRGELGEGEHAEFTLLQKKLAGADLSGSTIFTTLEPCTVRKEPKKPCAEWIIERSVRRVLIGMLDPNPAIYAQGFRHLREHGVEVGFFSETLRHEIMADNHAFIHRFRASPAASGEATFNYTDSDGRFAIGQGDYSFETRWSKASDLSIHAYKDGTNIVGLALAFGAKRFSDITDAGVYNMSSRVQTPQEGEFLVLKNSGGFFAAIKILDIKDRTRADQYDALTIEFRINRERLASFSD